MLLHNRIYVYRAKYNCQIEIIRFRQKKLLKDRTWREKKRKESPPINILQIEITVGKEEEEEEEEEGEKKKKKSVRHLRCWNRVGLGAKRGKRHHRRRYRAHNRHGGR